MKVQALANAWFGDRKIAKGEVFEIKERKGLRRLNKYSDYTEAVVITEEQQFSKLWMLRLEDDEVTEDEEAHNELIREAKANSDKLRSDISTEAEATLTEKPVKKKPLKKKAPKKPVDESVSEEVI